MSSRAIHLWSLTHKWTSLICTLFLLIICLTGLPLVFSDEIRDWLNDGPPYAALPADTPPASLDGMAAEARHRYPGQIITSVFADDDEPQVLVYMAPSWQDFLNTPRSRHWLKFDSRTAALLRESDGPDKQHLDFMTLMFRLHTDLFMSLPGELFLGAMALLFVTAIISGIVLYGPFTRKLAFGTVRTGRSRRVRWLDLHNLLGVTTLAWALVVGATGTLNELSKPLFILWQQTDVRAMLAPWHGQAAPPEKEWAPVQTAMNAARSMVPDMTITSIGFPGSPFGTPYHYTFWAKGSTPLTSRLFNPVLVDARTGKPASVLPMPWYLRALEVSRPLHFGDYGGTPLKILWVLLDLVTIAVLGSGLYLWLARRKGVAPSRLPRWDEEALPPAAAPSPRAGGAAE